MTHFCIIGAPKCGTSSLYQYLARHPDIELSAIKETNYFRSSLYDWRNEHRLRNWLRHCYLEASTRSPLLKAIVRRRYFQVCERKPGFVSGDGSINYFHEQGMPSRLSAYLPEAKLILILRNPVDRIYSNYWMNIRQGSLAGRFASFEEFVDEGHWYMRVNRYAENLREWLSYYLLDEFFLIKSEDFFDEPQQVLNELSDFLGIQEHVYSERIHEVPVATTAAQYPPLQSQTRDRLIKLLSYQQHHLLELTGKDFGWFSV